MGLDTIWMRVKMGVAVDLLNRRTRSHMRSWRLRVLAWSDRLWIRSFTTKYLVLVAIRGYSALRVSSTL